MAPNSLDDWLEIIAHNHPSEIEMGLDRIRSVFNRLQLISPPKKIVMVAGTNGKGSTVAMGAEAMHSFGYRVGTYTSPHIHQFNERITVNQQIVSDEALIKAFESVESIRSGVALTYFEFTTLAAFQILFNSNLDVVFLEIGLGGRLDAVNLVDADISIITSIGLDHTDWLGDDLESIASEKAGILRRNQIFLSGDGLPGNIDSLAKELECRHLKFDREFFISNSKYILTSLEGTKHTLDAPISRLPVNNVLLASQAVWLLLEQLSYSGFSEAEILKQLKSSIENTTVAGRLEYDGELDAYLDVGHNPQAARYLADFALIKINDGYYVEAVYSGLEDKDIASIIEIMSPAVKHWYIAPLSVPRAISIETLGDLLNAKNAEFTTFASIAEAINAANANGVKKQRVLLVFGSFFTVEAARN